MEPNIRVRFAPSPTGPLHIGGLRTALFNYLFAKKHGGSFILRIEDTDKKRYVPEAEQYIMDSLNWCGLTPDEGPSINEKFGPYRQSERTTIYREHIQQLVANGHAYYAFDTPDELDSHRKNHDAKGKTFIYNHHNRHKLNNSLNYSPEQLQEKLSSGSPYVIRFKSPHNESIVLQDEIRGTITIDSSNLDDKILFKSDGLPTYHFANVVDDHLMLISHVIRGEEWLPSLALHHLLYKALGWSAPKFAHLPLILKPHGKGKLSKRDGETGGFPVFPLNWNNSIGFREAGYFPQTTINFLALLGWNPGTPQEIFSLQELIDQFSLERILKSGSRFDIEKAKWYNHHYLQHTPNSNILHSLLPYLAIKEVPETLRSEAYVDQVITLLKERATFVPDFWSMGEYFFFPPHTFSEKAVKKHWKPETPQLLEKLLALIESLELFDSDSLSKHIKGWIAEQQLSFGKVIPPLRLAIVGDLKGPDLFAILSLLGKKSSMDRISFAIANITSKNTT